MILGKEPEKSGHLQSYGQIYFNIFQYILRKASLIWCNTRCIKNKNCFMKDLHWATCGLKSQTPEPPHKRFLSENVIFWGLKLSLGHFGQHAYESLVYQLQNGVSTSSLPPFIVDIDI